MKFLPLFVSLLVASPAFCQTPRYTNADLGQLVSSARVTPAEAAAILAPHQFALPAASPDGPHALVLGSSPTGGPFGEFPEFSPALRLDGTLLSDPQWGVTTWIPYDGWGGGYGGGRHVGGSPGRASGEHRPTSGRGARARR